MDCFNRPEALIKTGGADAVDQTDSDSKIIAGHFYFIDIKTQKKTLDDIEVDPKKPSFVNVALRDMGPKGDGYGFTVEPNTCMPNYSDKYEPRSER
ncbi:hypothetical protein AJ88_43735 [Mesorhizobium amorphae CCBAU 01583]|nr:hypothetical protein AJ88_43735 [Mesorhizobium amorphae CCBAU 01583]